jgi:alpha-N-arabinofuranosidase
VTSGRRLELAWGTTESNRFGTTSSELPRCWGRNPTSASIWEPHWDEAKFWVEYTNLKGGTRYSDLRRKNGREKPWGVTYWGLGNEMDGPWQMGYKSAEDYSKFALEAAKLMKWTDPNIKLIAAGSSNYNADWVGWNRTVLQNLKNHMDISRCTSTWEIATTTTMSSDQFHRRMRRPRSARASFKRHC